MGGIAILDMDGTILRKRSIDVLCKSLGLSRELLKIDRVSRSLPAFRVGEEIAKFFKGQSKRRLEEIFDTIPLSDGVNSFLEFLGRKQFLIAIATDSYGFLAQRLAQKVGADFVHGHIVEMEGDILTGRLLTPACCLRVGGCREFAVCKLDLLRRLKRAKDFSLAVGDGDSDFCVMTEADLPVAYRPRTRSLDAVTKFRVSSFAQLEKIVRREVERLEDKNRNK